jgi:tyrosine-protein phosphatase YwqE
MLKAYADLGITRIMATPHIFKEYYPNTKEDIHRAFTEVQKVAAVHLPQLSLGYAAEYYMDDHFHRSITETPLLTFEDNKVLVEQGYMAEIPGINKILFDMQIRGYMPVLAHPERYTYYHRNERKVEYFFDLGIGLQVNLLSLAGKYGKEVAKTASLYLSRGWVDYLGTDVHNLEDIALLKRAHFSDKDFKAIVKIMEKREG